MYGLFVTTGTYPLCSTMRVDLWGRHLYWVAVPFFSHHSCYIEHDIAFDEYSHSLGIVSLDFKQGISELAWSPLYIEDNMPSPLFDLQGAIAENPVRTCHNDT